jgi:hypothetical protein
MPNKTPVIIHILVAIVFFTALFFGLRQFYKVSIRASENRATEWAQATGMTNQQIATESKPCIDAGMDVFLNRKSYDGEVKVVSVQCTPKRVPKSTGEGISDAAMTAGAVYVGGKLLNYMLQ